MRKRMGYAATSGNGGIYEALNYAEKNDFSWVELSLNLPEFFPDAMAPAKWAQAGATAAELGISLTAHAPEDISLIHLHDTVRRAGLERMKEVMDWAHAVGVTRLTIHIGTSVYFTLPDGRQYLHQVYPEKFIATLRNSLDELREYARNKVLLCIENVSYFGPEVVQEVLADMLPEGEMYLTWDWGHSYGDPSQEGFMRKYSKYVRNCHVHDHNGHQDHLVVGDGCIDFLDYVRCVQDLDCPLIFEVRPREKAVESRNRFIASGLHLPGGSGRKLSDNDEKRESR